MTPAEFGNRFEDLFARSAFRLEALPFYVSAIEAEPFAKWQAGEHNDLAWRQPWRDRVGRALRRGAVMSRVHAMSAPLSDYERFQVEVVYPVSVDAGEDVRILPSESPDTLGPDFWLMDDQLAVMAYDHDGNWLSVDLDDDPHTVAEFTTRRDLLLRNAIPLADYVGRDSRRTA